MTPEQAIELVGRWPQDRTVPKKLRIAYDQARGLDRQQIGMLVEALMVASSESADMELIEKYFAF